MAVQYLSEDEYLAELNRRLRAHRDYQPGLAFLAHPPGATGSAILGMAIAGFHYGPAYMEVCNSMLPDFEIRVTQRQ
jgi:hypothetical protein